MPERICKDCVADGVQTRRPAPHQGPRCTTHHRARKKAVSAKAHGKRTQATFGLTEAEYWELHAYQRGLVAEAGGTGVDPIDHKSTGAAKRLAVDHDHETGEIRGLLSGRSNFDLLGRFDRAALVRAIAYLDDPPARKFFGEPRYVPEGTE